MRRVIVPALMAIAMVAASSANASAFGLFDKLCNKGCDSCCDVEPACGCEAACEPTCGCEAACEPSCGCEAPCEPTCGCEAPCEPVCGCEVVDDCCDPCARPKCGLKGLFSKMFKKHHNNGCEPACGCEPTCGCEAPCEPTCGCEPSCGCGN